MTKTGWTLAMLVALAACSPGSEQPAANQAEGPAANQPASQEEAEPVPALAGNWLVTSINGADLTQYYTMTAGATGDRLTITSDCVNNAWTYTQDRNVVAFTPVSANACRERTHNEDQIERVIKLANIAMFQAEGAEVELSGAGGRVTMTRR